MDTRPERVRDAVVLPVYNEQESVAGVLDAVRAVFRGTIFVVNDGSTDRTGKILAGQEEIETITHRKNVGYGQSLIDGFAVAISRGISRIVTMDCDGQHEPAHIESFLAALGEDVDIVSGSRYLPERAPVGVTPPSRREVNAEITDTINRATGWRLTDAFCGFKAYRVASLRRLPLREPGYAMPMELWARAYRAGLRIRELPIERIYSDHDRSFGRDLDDPRKRLAYYRRVWERALAVEANE